MANDTLNANLIGWKTMQPAGTIQAVWVDGGLLYVAIITDDGRIVQTLASLVKIALFKRKSKGTP